jgi:hypothetical protein
MMLFLALRAAIIKADRLKLLWGERKRQRECVVFCVAGCKSPRGRHVCRSGSEPSEKTSLQRAPAGGKLINKA